MFTMMNNARLGVGRAGRRRGRGGAAARAGLCRGPACRGRRRWRAPGRSSTMPMCAGCWPTHAGRGLCGPRHRAVLRGGDRHGHAPPASAGLAGPRGPADPDRQGLRHRYRPARWPSGRAGPWRHGLHRGDRRGAVPARRRGSPPIYEGTNGIQAMDLVGRKMADGGEAAFRLIDEVQRAAEAARASPARSGGRCLAAAEALRETTEAIAGPAAERPLRRGRALSARLCPGSGRPCAPARPPWPIRPGCRWPG